MVVVSSNGLRMTACIYKYLFWWGEACTAMVVGAGDFLYISIRERGVAGLIMRIWTGYRYCTLEPEAGEIGGGVPWRLRYGIRYLCG